MRTGEISETPVARMTPNSDGENKNVLSPEIKQIDKAAFDDLAAVHAANESEPPQTDVKTPVSDKRNWL